MLEQLDGFLDEVEPGRADFILDRPLLNVFSIPQCDQLRCSEDFKEGVEAFHAKRKLSPAVFEGRR
ncbi:MAG: hypothetical protein ACTSQ7_10035 [Alphaproteobacteria bacterium]